MLVHGSPDSIEEHLGANTPRSRFDELAAASDADLIACGHSHEAFARKVKGTWFVNPGSAGRPEGGDPRAAYALLRFSGGRLQVELRRVEYDIDQVVRAIRQAGLPESYADVFRQGRNLQQLYESRRMGVRTPKASRSRVRSTLDAVVAFARDCNYEREHAHHVTELAIRLFDQLRDLHGMGPRERLLLQYGALLHDIGWMEGRKGHHKTSLRLILEARSLPLDDRRRRIVGLIARYHRRSLPNVHHKEFGRLSPEDRHRVEVLGGILRVADGLDCTHTSAIRDVVCTVSTNRIRIACEADEPAVEETAAAEEKADLLTGVFHRYCIIQVRGRRQVARK
jgi:diadenosine tetraphosphatase ApaH/serine/threonine PP2A family protein phosphatase